MTAVVLNDKYLNDAVYRLIENSLERLTLVSPYFEPSPGLTRTIVAAAKRGLRVTVIVRDMSAGQYQNLRGSQWNALQELRSNGVTFKWLERLHAKIYVSEKKAIIASLNLVQTSFERSRETGVQFYSPDPQFEDARRRAVKLKDEAHSTSPRQRAEEKQQEEEEKRLEEEEEEEEAAGRGYTSCKRQRYDDYLS